MRALSAGETEALLAAPVVARLATMDAHGYPHVTPLWFLWVDGRVLFTSNANRPHPARIRVDPRVGLVIDAEESLRSDGERPNRQVRIVGDAVVQPDTEGHWTRRIRAKYIDFEIAPEALLRPTGSRVVVTVVPRSITAIASV